MNGLKTNLSVPVFPAAAGNDICAARTGHDDGSNSRQNECYIRTKTCAVLRELGIPDHLAGHLYLVEAVALASARPDRLKRITTDLYPAVANRYRTTPAAVERAIRHAVETGCCRCDPDTLCYYFGNTLSPQRGKPSNSELITRVVNLVRQGGVS